MADMQAKHFSELLSWSLAIVSFSKIHFSVSSVVCPISFSLLHGNFLALRIKVKGIIRYCERRPHLTRLGGVGLFSHATIAGCRSMEKG